MRYNGFSKLQSYFKREGADTDFLLAVTGGICGDREIGCVELLFGVAVCVAVTEFVRDAPPVRDFVCDVVGVGVIVAGLLSGIAVCVAVTESVCDAVGDVCLFVILFVMLVVLLLVLLFLSVYQDFFGSH